MALMPPEKEPVEVVVGLLSLLPEMFLVKEPYLSMVGKGRAKVEEDLEAE